MELAVGQASDEPQDDAEETVPLQHAQMPSTHLHNCAFAPLLLLLSLLAFSSAVTYSIVDGGIVDGSILDGSMSYSTLSLPNGSSPTEPPPPSRAGCPWRRRMDDFFETGACIGDNMTQSLSDAFALVRSEGAKADRPIGCWTPPVWTCIEGLERAMLVGPFESKAQQWHFVRARFPLLSAGDRIVEFTGDTVSATDATAPITYPPLHMHHIHIEREQPHFFETHGDYAMDTTRGYYFSLPKGTCFVHSPDDSQRRIQITAHVNDVRFSTSTAMASSGQSKGGVDNSRTAEAYGWYLRVRMRLAPPERECERVDKMALFYLFDALYARDALQRYDATNSTHVAFWTIRPTRSGTLLGSSARLHIHRARYAGYVLLRGQHTLAALTGLPASCGYTGEAGGGVPPAAVSGAATPPAECTSIERVREVVLAKARLGGHLLCHDDPSVPYYERYDHRGHGHDGTFDRQGRLLCSDFAFHQNEPLTVFSFSRPNWATDLAVFPQHVILFAYYKPEAIRRCAAWEKETSDDGIELSHVDEPIAHDLSHLPVWRQVNCLANGSRVYQWYVARSKPRYRSWPAAV